MAPKADGFSYTRHWHFAATGRLALLGRCAGTNQLGGLDQVAKDADLIQAYGLQVCVAATGNQLVENVGMGQKVFVHDQDDCPVHPVDSKRLQLVVYRRVQVRQSGNRRVAGHSADSGGWRGARVNRPAVRTKQGAKGSQTVLAHAEDGSDMADWAHSAVRDAPENCPPGSDCQDRIAKIGLPVSHHATTGNRPPDRNRSYSFGLPTNRPRSRAKTINTAPAPRANQYPVSRSETILIFISVLGSRYVDLPMKLVPAHPALS